MKANTFSYTFNRLKYETTDGLKYETKLPSKGARGRIPKLCKH